MHLLREEEVWEKHEPTNCTILQERNIFTILIVEACYLSSSKQGPKLFVALSFIYTVVKIIVVIISVRNSS